MKFVLFALLCLVGCNIFNIKKDKYYEQARILDRRMIDGDVGIFDEANVWGQKWTLIESDVEKIGEQVVISRKFRANDMVGSGENDDFKVTLILHYRRGRLESLVYSYVFHDCEKIVTGGADCDF